jgi:hypothetical protein
MGSRPEGVMQNGEEDEELSSPVSASIDTRALFHEQNPVYFYTSVSYNCFA